MSQNTWSRTVEDLIARVRAGENNAINEIDERLEAHDQSLHLRSVLRSLRAFCLMQSGRLEEGASEASALVTFAERHGHHDIVAQCYRLLAMQQDVLGEQGERHRLQRLAIAAAERSGDSLLLGRTAQEFALTIGESGDFEGAIGVLRQHWRPFHWDDSNETFFALPLAANLAWALNSVGRPDEALAITNEPPEKAQIGSFGAALTVERLRARWLLGQSVDIEAVEALLAESLENDWSMVTANAHLLLSHQYPVSSSVARTHAMLAANVQGLPRSYSREAVLRRAADCAAAHGDEETATELERQAQAIRDAALIAFEVEDS